MDSKIRKIVKAEIRKVMHVDREGLLEEGLISSAPLGNALSMLRYWGPRKHAVSMGHNATMKLDIQIDEKTDTLIVKILWFDRDNLEGFMKLSNNLGYFISEIGYKIKGKDLMYIKYTKESLEEFVDKKQHLDELIVILEAKFDIEVYKIPEKLYHICPQDNLEKILKIGLTPRSGSKISNHPERIYFAFTESNVLQIGEKFKEHEFNKINGYTLLEIDTSKVNQLRIFEDPNFKKSGVYALVNVPPDAITVLREKIKF
jgi:hypothetical protein